MPFHWGLEWLFGGYVSAMATKCDLRAPAGGDQATEARRTISGPVEVVCTLDLCPEKAIGWTCLHLILIFKSRLLRPPDM